MLRPTSVKGRAKATAGTTMLSSVVARFWDAAGTKALRMNPTNKLPEAPKKMEGGLKFKTRNPNKLPPRIAVAKAISDRLPSASVKIVTMENKAAPAARPSRPSIRLMALQISTTQVTVSARQMSQVDEPAR